MLETLINTVSAVPWYWVLAFTMVITFLENVFPPAPCDSFIIFTGTLSGIGTVGFVPLLVFSTIGSAAGFVFMYWLGYKFGTNIIEKNKIKFITIESLEAPERWFKRWGYYIIVINRFMSGTRAVISFFAGMTKLDMVKTNVLAAISAAAWNAILIYIGMLMGENWHHAANFFSLYGMVITPIIIFAILAIAFYLLLRRHLEKKKQTKS